MHESRESQMLHLVSDGLCRSIRECLSTGVGMSTLAGISDRLTLVLLQKLRALSRLRRFTRGTVDDHGTVFIVTSQVGITIQRDTRTLLLIYTRPSKQSLTS